MEPGLTEGGRQGKDKVNYRQLQKCGVCDHFYAPRTCDLVDGTISPDCVCDRFEIKSTTQYRDKEFFVNEFNKTQPK